MPKKREEEHHQVAFVSWFRKQYPKYKDLLTLASIGENVGPRRMARLKQMGLTPGYPDLMLCVPCKVNNEEHFHGLFIEMKTLKGRVAPNQKEIHELLKAHGYHVGVCRSWDEAKELAGEYLRNCI